MDRRLNSHLAHHRPQDGNTRGKGKVARAEHHPAAQCKSDGGRGAWPDTPMASKGLPSLEGRSFRSSEFALSGLADVSIEALLQEQQQLLSLGPPFMGPRARLQQWREVVQADPTLLKVISQGVRLPLNHIPPPNPRSPPMPLDLSSVVQKYTDLGVIRPLSASEVLRTQNWVQTFGRPKPNSSELRLITDLRPLNQSLQPQFFKGDHWGTVVQMLNDHPEHCWATTLDIKACQSPWLVQTLLENRSGESYSLSDQGRPEGFGSCNSAVCPSPLSGSSPEPPPSCVGSGPLNSSSTRPTDHLIGCQAKFFIHFHARPPRRMCTKNVGGHPQFRQQSFCYGSNRL